MGFDIYGLSPQLKSKQPTIDWENATKEDQDNYFQKRHKWEDENPGSYFRNNVWWWRPLADLILDKCSDLSLIDSGFIDEHQKEIDARIKIAKTHNAKIEKKLDDLKEKVMKLRPNENLAPVNYPYPYNKHWEEIQQQKDWGSSYPFSKENVIEFITFSRASGGFEIC